VPSKVNVPLAWLRLFARYRVTVGFKPEPAFLLDGIQPTTDMDALLRIPKIQGSSASLTGTLGVFVPIFTVPQGKRWFVTGIWREAATGVTQVAVTQVNGGNTFLPTVLQAAEDVVASCRYCLDQGGEVGLLATGNGADTAISLKIIYEEEDAWPTPEGPGV